MAALSRRVRSIWLAATRQKNLRNLTASFDLDAEVVVVGAGVVGLAVARQLAVAGRDTLVVEAAGQAGTITSSRNSEVIHAGIYYPPGSLKARTCVAGKHALYRYCAEHAVPHRRLGKLIVAVTSQQIPALRALQQAAAANGVTDLQWLAKEDAQRLEPEVECAAALLSPSTGIVDSHSFMAQMQQDLEAHRGTVAFHSRVERGNVSDQAKTLVVRDTGSGEQVTLKTGAIINCAGLFAQRVASSLSGLPVSAIPPLRIAKGSYFSLRSGLFPSSRPLFSRLVYPLPTGGGLGVHVTLDLSGGVRLGPDVEWLPPGTDPDEVDYAVSAERAAVFESAARTFWPSMPDGCLEPAYSGARPKVREVS